MLSSVKPSTRLVKEQAKARDEINTHRAESYAGEISLGIHSRPPDLEALKILTRHLLSLTAMASRRLALSLNQALRSRTALNSVRPKRGFATPVNHGVKTESTTLSNGLTVCYYHRCLWSWIRIDLATDRDGALAMGPDLDRWCVD